MIQRDARTVFCCFMLIAAFPTATTMADDWPQWRGPRRDGVWREKGILKKFDKPRLDPVWRVEIGSGYSGPTVANGRVYVTDRLVEPKQIERVHCFDARTGKKVWTHTYDCPYRGVQYEAGPRASVLIDNTRAFALGTMGHFFCFDSKSGEVRWKKDLNQDYKIRMPIWGIASSPLIEGDLIIVQIGGEAGACLVAFDKKSGKEKWRALDDPASYAAPVVIEQAGRRVLVCYTGANVVGLDPQTGRVHWRHPFPPRRMIIGIATPVYHKGMLFMSNFFDGSLLLRLGRKELTVEKVWQRAGASEKETDSLQSIISTPYLQGDSIYGVDSYGELRCLDLMTGDRIWENTDAVPRARWATIHFVRNGDRIWMFNEMGELIIATLSPEGYKEISRAKLIDPTRDQLPSRRGGVCWSHPAFANKHVFARNDKELVCASLAAD
ncbi:MAG: PQQ-like beta-propeller repeat protein [Phycisphaerales bacterium]|nr:PQQ-like beta-propeller repeat protein [Phycisphaerales bacterium]